DGQTYNAALFAHGGKILSKTFKHHLPFYGVFDESRIFAQGYFSVPVDFKGKKIGILICEDIWHAEGAAFLKERGADIILSPNASPYDLEKRKMRRDVASARARESGLPLVYVNQIGGQDELVFDGGSFALDADGALVAQAPYCETYTGPCDFIAPEQDENRQVYDVLTLGLKDYVEKNGFPGVLLGMSGGIDSALAATLAADALGAGRVRCVMMPSPYTSEESMEDAKDCAARLGCPYEIIPIEPAMKAFEGLLPDLAGLAHENMQSRVRGLILMALSNGSGAMVLTTGNKSEIATGYTTLYGDMCGGFNALKDVYKTRIFALARWRNGLGENPPIPERIITKPPSAELRPLQKDEDSLPPYDILDAILERLIEREQGVDAVIAEGFDAATVRKIFKLLNLAEYKRRQAAPGVKITTRAFGRDRRYPITGGYRFFVENS
ncbi:MAG: NAD+ synthase, partial [Micavibrio sp.]